MRSGDDKQWPVRYAPVVLHLLQCVHLVASTTEESLQVCNWPYLFYGFLLLQLFNLELLFHLSLSSLRRK